MTEVSLTTHTFLANGSNTDQGFHYCPRVPHLAEGSTGDQGVAPMSQGFHR